MPSGTGLSAEELAGQAYAEAQRAHARLDALKASHEELSRRVGDLPDELEGTPATGLAKILLEIRDGQRELRAAFDADLASRRAADKVEALKRVLPFAALAVAVIGGAFTALSWLAKHVTWKGGP
jgi:hypothetical protein